MNDAIQEQPERRLEQREISVMVGHQEAWSGPLPPPEILARFDQAVPGSAGRIITMAESQQQHRIEVERSVAVQETQIKRDGLNFAYRLAVIGLLGAVATALVTQNPYAVGIIVGGGLITLVTRFIPRGKKKED